MTETFTSTLTRLGTAQKGRARGAPAYSVYVNRRLGRVLAAAAYRLGLSPNQVTGVSAAFTFTGVGLLATVRPGPVLGVVVWLLLALGYAWDSADGQVARLRGGGSLSGEWLDHVVDALKISCLHLAVAVGTYRFAVADPGPAPAGAADDALGAAWLLVPLGFAVVGAVTFFAMILNDLLKGKHGVPPTAARGGSSPLRSLVLLPTDYGFLCAVFVLWGWPPAFRLAYALVALACALFLAAALVRWFREMSSLDTRLR